MYTTYRINADDLNPDFVESLKILFRHKQIEISVHETHDTVDLSERREQLVAEVQDALALFRQGQLTAQTSDAIIAELNR
ncbi:MAG: hypothetical protein HOP34_05390 [Methylococcaceae bacterium]|nr:hypothetical protein [Methylococcaceae bacterium]